MNNYTVIIVIFSSLIIILSLIWILRIRKSKMQDPDYDHQDAAMKEDEATNPDA